MNRINKKNTLIEDYLYPFSGAEDEEVIDYFTDFFKPYTEIINQIEAAVMFHNKPLYAAIIFILAAVIYFLKIVSESQFPTFLFVCALVPIYYLFILVGGGTILKSLCIEMPKLPDDAPDRIRSVREIVEIIYKPLRFTWQIGYFIYHAYVCPNLIDTVVILIGITLLGMICCVIDFWIILAVPLVLFVIVPGILTQKAVYSFIMLHLGHPLPDDPKKED